MNKALQIILLSASLCLAMLSSIRAQNTISWTGSVNGDWSNAGNWSGTGAPPGTAATDIARFDANPANKAVSIGTATTIDSMEFVSGAGSYAISGAALTLNRISTTGASISNSSGRDQTISSQVYFSGSTILNVSVGSSLTFASAISKTSAAGNAGNLTITGGGGINFNGSFSPSTGSTLFSNLIVREGSTVNYNTTSYYGPNNYQADGGRINLHRSTGTSGITLQLLATDSEIYLSKSGLTVGAAVLRFRGDGAAGKTLTFGADFAGTDTATYSGLVNLNHSGALANQTYRFTAAVGNTLALKGVISDTSASASGTKVEITGAGKVRFTGVGSNTSKTPIEIAAGATLELAKTDGALAIADQGSITVRGTTGNVGKLVLDGNNQIGDTTALTLAGGAFEVGEFTETLGALSVGEPGGEIVFDGTGSVTFASLSSIVGTLTITGWGEGNSIFFTDGSAWNETTLAKIIFTGFGAAQYDPINNKLIASTAPIPEPATTAALLAGFAVLAVAVRFRRR